MRNRSVTIWLVLVFLVTVSTRADFILHGNEQFTVNSYHTYGILYDTSQVSIVSGGTISSFLDAYDSSTANISSGYVSSLAAWNSSTVDISGGTVRDLSPSDYSKINISGGSITENFNIFNFSTVDISGGSISYFLGARNSSAVNISGGSVSYLYTEDNGDVDISGGSVSSLYAIDSSVVSFHGRNFSISGGLVLDGERVLGLGILSGEWMDGTPWAVDILQNESSVTILVVPEPGTLLLLGIGAVMLRRRR